MSDTAFVDESGTTRLKGRLNPVPASLPTGWTQDAGNPAELSSNGGSLVLGGGSLTAGATPGASSSLAAGSLNCSDTATDTAVYLDPVNLGIFVRPPAALPALTVANDHAPPGCIDRGGVPLLVSGSRAAYVNPLSVTFNADLISSLQASGFMAPAP